MEFRISHPGRPIITIGYVVVANRVFSLVLRFTNERLSDNATDLLYNPHPNKKNTHLIIIQLAPSPNLSIQTL